MHDDDLGVLCLLMGLHLPQGSLLVACGAAGEMEMAAILWWELRQQRTTASELPLDLFHAMMTAAIDNHQVGVGRGWGSSGQSPGWG